MRHDFTKIDLPKPICQNWFTKTDLSKQKRSLVAAFFIGQNHDFKSRYQFLRTLLFATNRYF
ncbi:hypothetical protein B0181_00945 [Moraxella caviae]|uniref:Uncharacterized protein n=1 Tax=Moraxella caviae TaxID=34060 RepID=A0A1T0ABQ5_9GAMM|nr:hypothetical protein B0181_00945 [Moraxella caviae]